MTSEKHDIFLRALAVLDNQKEKRKGNATAAGDLKWPGHALVFDTETRITADQSLTFGVYRFCALVGDSYAVIEEGIFYADDLAVKEREVLETHVRGLLLRRPVRAMTPFIFIGKEIERRAQEGGDVGVLENAGPIQYHRHQTAKTRVADAGLIAKARRFPLRQLMRESGASQHAIERFLDAERVHPATRVKLLLAVENLERVTLRTRTK